MYIAPSLKCEFRSWRESVRKCVHVCIYSSWARPCQPTSACPLQHGVGGRPQRPSNQPWTKPISRCPGASRTPTATSPEAPGELLEMPHDPARGAGVHSCTIWRRIMGHLQELPWGFWAGCCGCSGCPRTPADGFSPWLVAGSLWSAPNTMLQRACRCRSARSRPA